jgi:hypothetical protein
MIKIGLLLFLLFPSIIAFSQAKTQDFEKLDIEKVISDIDTIKQEMDSTFYYINGTYKILKEEVELFGWKKTIQINSDIFLPFVIFIVLYLLWLRGRRIS